MTQRAFGILIFLCAFSTGYLLVPQTPVVETRALEIRAIERSGSQGDPDDKTLETIEESRDDRPEDSVRIRLLETGEGFHGNEVMARDGEKWLGLFETSQGYSFRYTHIIVKRVHDPIIDEVETARTGKTVQVRADSNPIFLVKNAKELREGEVETVFRGLNRREAMADDAELSLDEKLTRLGSDFLQTFEMGGGRFTLRVMKAKSTDGERVLALVLESDGTRQILHTMRPSYEGELGPKEWLGQLGTLYWIGDVDGDKRPDFYLDLFWHDNISDLVLFLSSKVRKGQLVRKAARFTTSGC